jgi:hypothetical protein
MLQNEIPVDKIVRKTWEGIGDLQMGMNIIRGKHSGDYYTMRDAGVIK